jgi:hypothetical protein
MSGNNLRGWAQWFTSVILATQKVKIMRMAVLVQHRQKVSKASSQSS